MIKKIKSMLLVFCMVLCTVMANDAITQAGSSDTKALLGVGNVEEGLLMKQQKKYQQKDTSQDKAKKAYKELLVLLNKNEIVKKAYAGAYINNNNILVVQLTTFSQEIRNTVQESIKSQKVAFEQKRYTYDELMETYGKICDAMKNAKVSTKYIATVSVDVINNVVKVGLRDLSYKDKFLTDICNHKCIQFEKNSKKITPDVSYLRVGEVCNVKEIRYTVKKNTDTEREVTVKSVKNKAKKNIKIPATVKIAKKTYKVVGIEKSAFSGMKKLKTVTIGKNVRDIQNKAFMKCRNLTGVKILSRNCSFSGRSIWKGTSKKLVVKFPKSSLKKMQKRMKKSGLNKSAVKAL